MADWYRVTFTNPSGYRYEVTGQASGEAEAVRLADETLEYVERIGISDYLDVDGLSVRPPAPLAVERVDPSEAGSGFGLVITDPAGRVTRK
jgi:hypothetical protein